MWGPSAPSFADLDGDGDLDAVVGDGDGVLNYFKNTGSATAPAFDRADRRRQSVRGRRCGRFSARRSFADLDGDGDLDAVIGAVDGTLLYFENTGSATAPDFTERAGAANPFAGVNVGSLSTPSFADLDGDGDLDAIVGEAYGAVRSFQEHRAGFELMVDVTAESDAPVLANAIGDQSSPANAYWSFQVPANTFTPVGGGGPLTYAATLANGDPLP